MVISGLFVRFTPGEEVTKHFILMVKHGGGRAMVLSCCAAPHSLLFACNSQTQEYAGICEKGFK